MKKRLRVFFFRLKEIEGRRDNEYLCSFFDKRGERGVGGYIA
jgi:hypothetical protein